MGIARVSGQVIAIAILVCSVVTARSRGQSAAAQAPAASSPATNPMQSCTTPGPAVALGAPGSPGDLISSLAPVGPPPEFGARLHWKPVPNATCIGVEKQDPITGQWEVETIVAGTATESGLLVTPEPGQNCFRSFAANQAGRSGYSNVACVEVPGARVTFPAGWNLTSVPDGETVVTGADGPLYTWDQRSGTYTTIPAGTVLNGGNYWVYFDTPTTETFPAGLAVQSLVPVPAGQWMLIGNPRAYEPEAVQSVAKNGAPTILYVYVYNPRTASYVQTTTLQPGQAAWVYSPTGGLIGLG